MTICYFCVLNYNTIKSCHILTSLAYASLICSFAGFCVLTRCISRAELFYNVPKFLNLGVAVDQSPYSHTQTQPPLPRHPSHALLSCRQTPVTLPAAALSFWEYEEQASLHTEKCREAALGHDVIKAEC